MTPIMYFSGIGPKCRLSVEYFLLSPTKKYQFSRKQYDSPILIHEALLLFSYSISFAYFLSVNESNSTVFPFLGTTYNPPIIVSLLVMLFSCSKR